MASLFDRGTRPGASRDSLEARHALLERLSRIQRSISHGAPQDEVLAAIAVGAAELLNDPVAGLRLIAEDDPTSMVLVASEGLTAEQWAEVRHGKVGEGAGGRAIVEDDVVVVEDYPDTSDGIARFGEFGVQNALAAPIRVRGRVVGSLTVASFEPGRRYTPVEQEILSALAEHAGLALLDASLIDDRERFVEQRGEERFHALVRHSSDLIAIVEEDGAISFATPSVGRVLGVAPEALLQTTLLAHIHPADRPRAAQMLHTAAGRPGTLPPADWRLVPSGAQFAPQRWMHVEVLATNLLDHPSVRGIVVNARDVTERKRAEQERRERDSRYRQIVDTTHDGVWVTDAEDRTVFVNHALARMLGRTPEEIVGRRVAEFLDPDQARIVQAAMERRRRGVSERYELTLRRADGSPLQVTISGTPIFEEGRFSGTLALCGDITELVRARDEQHRLESQLQQAQELAMLGRLAGQVAHDFNQVLAVILGYADLLRANVGDQKTKEDVTRITEAAAHGAALARQLVTFSRRDEGEPEVLDLAEVTREVARLVGSTAPPGVAVQARGRAQPLPVCIDPTKLRQVLMNLIDNAFDAMPGGGSLTLTTGTATLTGPAHEHPAPGLPPGEYVSLIVSDSGHGMNADVVARALEPAFTTKPSGEGTGLGLAIVHGVIQAAGGHISLRSRPDQGTTIALLLPRAAAAATTAPAAAPADDAVPAAPATSDATILLVEDDASVLALTRRVLSEQGFAVLPAGDAESALAVARTHEVDLLLTDQTMPGMPGIELARQVAGVRPGTPTIVMSGYVAAVAAPDDAGVVWLQKPFGADALLGAVRHALAHG